MKVQILMHHSSFYTHFIKLYNLTQAGNPNIAVLGGIFIKAEIFAEHL